MNLDEEYKRAFIALLTDEDSYSHGWITVQRMVFSKEDSYKKTGVLDSKHDRMFIPEVCKAWLYARVFGPVSKVWVACFFCKYSNSHNVELIGGLTVFGLMVSVWEGNLRKVISDGKDKESFNVFAMLHYKKDDKSIWANLSVNSNIPSVVYSAVTSEEGLFKNGEYEWIVLAGPSILRMFTTGNGGIAYQHQEGFLYNAEDQYSLVLESVKSFDKEAAQVMMFLEGKAMNESSVTVVHAARECRIFESVFFHAIR